MRRRFVILVFALLLVASEAGQAGRWKSKKKKKASVSVGADGSTSKADAGPSTAETIARLKKAGYDPDDAKADHTQKGIELDGKGDKAGSIVAFAAAAKHEPSATTLMNFAVSLMRQAKLKEAREAMEKALDMAPNDENVLGNLKALEGAEKEMGVGPPPSARKGKKKSNKYQRPGAKAGGKKNKYQRPGSKKKNKYKRPGGGQAGRWKKKGGGDEYDSSDPKAEHTKWAIKFDGQGRKEESLDAFRAAAEFEPKVYTFQMNYAVSLMRMRMYKKALPAMEAAVKLAPAEAQVKDNMAALTQSISVDDGSPEAVALRKEHPGRFDRKDTKKAKRKKKYQ